MREGYQFKIGETAELTRRVGLLPKGTTVQIANIDGDEYGHEPPYHCQVVSLPDTDEEPPMLKTWLFAEHMQLKASGLPDMVVHVVLMQRNSNTGNIDTISIPVDTSREDTPDQIIQECINVAWDRFRCPASQIVVQFQPMLKPTPQQPEEDNG